MVAAEIGSVTARVAFPAYSKLQNDVNRLRRAILSTMGTVSLVSIPIAGGMFVLAPDLTFLLLGEKWMPMVPAFRLLCITGAARSITSNFGPVFLSVGRPDIQAKASTMNLILLGALIYPMVSSLGMMGAVYARLATLLTQAYTWPKFFEVTGIKTGTVRRLLASPTVATLVMIAAVAGTRGVIGARDGLALVVCIIIGMVVYLAALRFVDGFIRSGHLDNLREIARAVASNAGD
jgi:PST family polysaccharide transporter/lipopolysaccharide exporter